VKNEKFHITEVHNESYDNRIKLNDSVRDVSLQKYDIQIRKICLN